MCRSIKQVILISNRETNRSKESLGKQLHFGNKLKKLFVGEGQSSRIIMGIGNAAQDSSAFLNLLFLMMYLSEKSKIQSFIGAHH